MLLYEFFGNITKHDKSTDSVDTIQHEENKQLADDVFWFMLDDDLLHKKYVMPLLNKLADNIELATEYKTWMQIVKIGCIKYFKEQSINGSPYDTFNKEFRMDLCKRLGEHFREELGDNNAA